MELASRGLSILILGKNIGSPLLLIDMLTYFCLATTTQVPIVISVQKCMCTKDRNVYIQFVRVSNILYYYARYLLRLWCSRIWHGGMVSRGRWYMRWWWFSLTDILIHIIHVIHTYVHTLGWGGDTPAAPTLFRLFGFFWGFFSIHIHICPYSYICTYTHIHIYTIHTYVNIHILATMHTQVRGRYPSCTVYILPRHCIPGWGGDTPAAPWHVLAYMHYGKGNGVLNVQTTHGKPIRYSMRCLYV